MISLSELIAPVTSDDFMAKTEELLAGLGVDVSKFRRGGALRVLMRAQSMTLASLTEIMTAAIRGGFLDLAERDWLTMLARYVFGVERREAQPASGTVTFVNGGGGTFLPGDYPAGSVRLFSSRTGKKYHNAEPLDLGPGATKSVAVVAVEVGPESWASAGDIDELETSLLGVSVSNPEAVVGLPEETDDELRLACRARVASISDLGPRGAYLWAVRQAKRLDGSPTAINRVHVPEGSWTASVDVVLASASGAPIAGDVTAAAAAIEAMARPSGIKATVSAAVEVPFARVLTVWVARTPGLNLDGVRAAADLALANAFRTYPVGGRKKPTQETGYLYADFVKSTCRVHAAVFDVDLDVDTDLPLAANEVATWTGSVQVRQA